MGEEGKGQKPAWMPDTLTEGLFWFIGAMFLIAIVDIFFFPGRNILGELSPYIDTIVDAVAKFVQGVKDII